MYYGRVVGSATATVKHPSMEGCKLLLVMALEADGRTPEGDPILVVDRSHHGCRVIAEELAAAGYHVEWTNDPGAAPRMIAARRYSLFIAGQGQPALTGPAIVAAVWHDPTLPVLLIEAVTEQERPAPDTEFLARVRNLVRPRRHDS